jgi:hypothetical protein
MIKHSYLFLSLDDGEYQRSSLFVSGKFADFKRQQAGHIVDIAESSRPVKSSSSSSAALPRLGAKPSSQALEDDDTWYEEENGRDLLKRMGYRDEDDEDGGKEEEEVYEVVEEVRAQGRMAEDATEDEGIEYEDYVEDDGKTC